MIDLNKLASSSSWQPPTSIAGGLLPNSLPPIVKDVINQDKLIKDLLPELPKIPTPASLKRQLMRYVKSSLLNDQTAQLIDIARNGGLENTPALILMLKKAGILDRLLP